MKAVVFCFVALFAGALGNVLRIFISNFEFYQVFRFQHVSLRLAAPRILEDTDIDLPSDDDRIVSGRKAIIEEFPYTLSLKIGGVHEGGASVLTTTKALTCAHLLHPSFPPSKFSIKAGSNYRQDRADPHAQIRIVFRYIVHPQFKPSTLQNDIGIVQWVKPLDFGTYVKPVFIPPPNYEVPYGKLAHTTGWGFVDSRHTLPERLHEMRTPLVNNEECVIAQGNLHRITADMICAGTKIGVQGICNGDNGGPLVYISGDKFLQLGVVSWSRGCAERGKLDVYARVPHFSTWIRKHL